MTIRPARPAPGSPHPLTDVLPVEAVRLDVAAPDWTAALRAAGDALVASGATTPAYTDEMIAAVTAHGPYIVIAPGIALAHSRPSPAVARTGFAWVRLAEPVAFGDPDNDPVRLVVGLASPDHEGHVRALSAVARLLGDEPAMDALAAADSPQRVRELIAAFEQPAPG